MVVQHGCCVAKVVVQELVVLQIVLEQLGRLLEACLCEVGLRLSCLVVVVVLVVVRRLEEWKVVVLEVVASFELRRRVVDLPDVVLVVVEFDVVVEKEATICIRLLSWCVLSWTSCQTCNVDNSKRSSCCCSLRCLVVVAGKSRICRRLLLYKSLDNKLLQESQE